MSASFRIPFRILCIVTLLSLVAPLLPASNVKPVQAALSGTRYDDIDPAIIYLGSWSALSGLKGPDSGTLHLSVKIGDNATLTFNGDRVGVLYSLLSGGGKLEIKVDGIVKVTLSQSASTRIDRRWWRISGLGSGNHILTLTHISGSRANLDAVMIDSAPETAGVGQVDDADPTYMAYDGAWLPYSGLVGPAGGTQMVSNRIGDAVRLQFNASRISINYALMSGGAGLDVYLDDVLQARLSQTSSRTSYGRVWSSPILASGQHTLRLVHATTGKVNLDAVHLQGAPTVAAVGTVDDADRGLIAYQGYWQPSANLNGSAGKTLTSSLTVGDRASFQFNGNRLSLVYSKQVGAGRMEVWLDGILKTTLIQAYTAARYNQILSLTDLSDGQHLLELVHKTAGKVNLDSLIVRQIVPCTYLPANNIWNTPVDTLPLDTRSSQYVAAIGVGSAVHADFGAGLWNGGPIGIPSTIVNADQAKVKMTFGYADESDPGPYPFPANAAIEGGPNSGGDRHVLVVDSDNCVLYETFDSHRHSDGSWYAGSGAVFDLKSNALRPDGWTSADAAGLPILPGLVRYDEVAAGEIKHAIRFTVPKTQKAYVWPARHYASSDTNPNLPPMGQRFRLKASFDISGYPATDRVILRALQTYGMILADNGSSWYLSGMPDSRWNNDVLHQLGNVKGSDFEAVDVSELMVDPNSGQVKP